MWLVEDILDNSLVLLMCFLLLRSSVLLVGLGFSYGCADVFVVGGWGSCSLVVGFILLEKFSNILISRVEFLHYDVFVQLLNSRF